MSETGPVVIIGAGPAGIGAGLALGERGLVLEPCSHAAGLCRTIHLEGAVFDYGGHSFHTPHPEIRRLVFDALPMFEQTRQAVCYTQGVMIPYPFQVHFERLADVGVVQECRDGLQSVSGGANAGSFPELLVGRFGEGIARHFLVPYNQKLWGDLGRLATDWVQERVAAPRGTQESFSETGGVRRPLQSDTTVAYPAQGGFEEIMLALARRLNNLCLGQTVVQIDPRRRELLTRGGEIIYWSRLVSTIPIDQLFGMIPSAPADLLAASRDLLALPVDLVLVVTARPIETSIQRVYCAGPEIPAHKIVLNHNSSPSLRSLPHHGIQAEVSAANGPSPCARELVENVVLGLVRMGFLESSRQIVTTQVIRVPRAYPVPTRDRDAIIGRLTGWLEDQGIYSVGRFGQWAYINADESLHRGLVLGRRILERCASSLSVA